LPPGPRKSSAISSPDGDWDYPEDRAFTDLTRIWLISRPMGEVSKDADPDTHS